MKINELKKGTIYTDADGVNAYAFIEMRNYQLATFAVCEYDEEKGDYIATPEKVYLTANEVSRIN